MKTVTGTYAEAKIFSDNAEEYAIAQIRMICDHEISQNSRIRVMPDVHPGKVGTVGLTMTVEDKMIPYLLGGDIGCGMSCRMVKGKRVEGAQLDSVIRDCIPSGFAIRKEPHRCSGEAMLQELICFPHINRQKAVCSIGTLGGGNHFIEVGTDGNGTLYVTVHSGSRHLGVEVTEYYQNLAYQSCREKGIPHPISWLEGAALEDYLHDMKLVQEYASLNRRCILDEICRGMKWKALDSVETVHNYVGTLPDGRKILRKGAVAAMEGERLLIPVNMKEGMLVCTGKGNPDWNYSAPHGAGRIYRRDQVKEHYTVSDFKKEMKGIYTSCIGKGTLDEAPFAYRKMEEIAAAVQETVVVEKVIRPFYNFKAGNEK